MIKSIAFVLMFSLSLYAGTLKNYTIESKDSAVDVILNFDEIFSSEIKQQKGDNFIKIILDNVIAKENVEDNINSDLVTRVNIVTYADRIEIILSTKDSVNLLASKTVDGYGIRLRIKGNKAGALSSIKEGLDTKTTDKSKANTDYSRYYYVVAMLMLIIVLLFIVRQYFQKMKFSAKGVKSKGDIEFLYQKLLDEKNRFTVMKFDDVEYTLIIGQTNILLNKKDLTISEPPQQQIVTKTKRDESKDSQKEQEKSKKAEFENILKKSGIDLENANIIVKN